MTTRSSDVTMEELCQSCGTGRVETVQRGAEHFDGMVRVAYADELSRCRECGEEFYTYEQSLAHSRALTAALREAEGLLSPERIRSARLRLKMTQPQFEQAMGVGPKTTGRWERGTVPPSRAANLALWVAEKHPDVFLEYARERVAGLRLPPQDAEVVGTIITGPSSSARPTALKYAGTSTHQLTTQLSTEKNQVVIAPQRERIPV